MKIFPCAFFLPKFNILSVYYNAKRITKLTKNEHSKFDNQYRQHQMA